jgi:ATP/maltotriose-dependent transcriptional regulator MalT
VYDLLARLVERSLAQVEAGEDAGEPRYRLLETLRQYAWERLEAAGEAEPARDRHARWFVALAEALEERRWGGQQEDWVARLEPDFDNLRAALAWAAGRGDGEAALRLGGAVYLLWIHRGSSGEGRALLARALAAEAGRGPGAARPARLARAKALHGLGVLAREQGDYAAARAAFAESLAIRREAGDRWGAALALQNLGRVVEARGEADAARAHFEESLALFRELGDRRRAGGVLANLGDLAWRAGDATAARALLEESLALARATGDALSALTPLGRMLCALGDVAAARPLLLEDAARLRAMGSPGLIAWQALDNLACLAAAEGEAARALRLGGAAEALREQAGMRLPPGDVAQLERLLAPSRRALGEAARAAAWAEGRAMTVEQAVAEALDDSATAPAAEQLSPAESPVSSGLSRREVEVLRLLAAGRSNRQIAADLSVSVRTIERHVGNLYGKIDAHNRADATAFAFRHGLL